MALVCVFGLTTPYFFSKDTFTTIANYPGIPHQTGVSGKVAMRVLP